MAIGFFQEAIARHPDYALAYVGLAHCYAQIPVFGDTPSTEVVGKIRAAASKALELDSTLGAAHLDLARAYETEFNWPEAEREFKTAAELSPGDSVGAQWYGVHLWRMGRREEALAQHKMALDLDPISPGATHAVGRSLYFLGRYDESIDQYQKALTLESDSGLAHGGLGLVYLAKGIFPRAVTEMELSFRLMGQDAWHAGQLGYVYGMSGNTAAANKILSEFFNHARSPRALAIATVYIGLRDKDHAFEWLQKAVDQHDVFLLLKSDPQYAGLSSDPRFADLLRRMKLN
jgi:tetratricopeptide (TPR) repeat protein